MAVAILGLAMLTLPALGENKKIVLGAGCFWCIESLFQHQPGVVEVAPGYAGGSVENPTYKQVCTGKTGHAETVQVTYDPEKTDLSKLLAFFFKIHDASDPTGVWPDFGPQYRSIILYSNEEEHAAIEAAKAEAQKSYAKPIATEIAQLKKFYPAEDYHKDYARKNPGSPYIQRVLVPKLKKQGYSLEEK